MPNPDENESAEEVDDFLLDEFESDDDATAEDPDGSGLELGAAQAEEIRRIFMTTLPQYLEPLEELMEQALAQSPPEAAIIDTLAATVASILTAARRIGVGEIADSLVEMQVLIEELAVSDPDEVADELRGTLRKIKERSGATDGPSGASQTIVAALGAAEGLDTGILESLTAAGLLTVSQLRMARKHEIVAVTGLPVESVDALLGALGIELEERARTPGVASRREDGELERHLRAQVEAEDALVQARAEVQRVRGRLETVTQEIERAEVTTSGLRSREAEARARGADLLEARARAHETLATLEAKRADLEERVLSARQRLLRLDRDRERVADEQEALRDRLSELGERVRLLLATADEVRER